MGWHLLGGLSQASKEVRSLLDRTEVPETPVSFAKQSKTDGIHAMQVQARLWGTEREVVVHTNANKAVADRIERNEALSRIGKTLAILAKQSASLPAVQATASREEPPARSSPTRRLRESRSTSLSSGAPISSVRPSHPTVRRRPSQPTERSSPPSTGSSAPVM